MALWTERQTISQTNEPTYLANLRFLPSNKQTEQTIKILGKIYDFCQVITVLLTVMPVHAESETVPWLAFKGSV